MTQPADPKDWERGGLHIIDGEGNRVDVVVTSNDGFSVARNADGALEARDHRGELLGRDEVLGIAGVLGMGLFDTLTDGAPVLSADGPVTKGWWWLSFVGDESDADGNYNLGCCIVRAWDMLDAVAEAHRQGCNPGGQVSGACLSAVGDVEGDPDSPLNQYGPNRLLSWTELEAAGEAKVKDLDPEMRARLGYGPDDEDSLA